MRASVRLGEAAVCSLDSQVWPYTGSHMMAFDMVEGSVREIDCGGERVGHA